MYLLGIDRTQNRIHITLLDRIDELQAKALLEEARTRLEELVPRFHVLCDLTALEELDHSAVKHFEAMMDLYNEYGVCKVIRIIPNPLQNFGFTIMSQFHYDREIPIITCSNFQEALAHLKKEVRNEI
jgi:hypothetical protein